MADDKVPLPKVDFSDGESPKNSSRKTIVATISIITVILLLGTVISVTVFFVLKKNTPNARLVEVNLKEGDTLTYQVDQNIEVQVGEIQKGMFVFIFFIFVRSWHFSCLNRIPSISLKDNARSTFWEPMKEKVR